MATVAYNYINQTIQATAVIQPLDNDSFYNPVTQGHTGFAADGSHYTNGVQDLTGSPPLPTFASWFTEFSNTPNVYRGDQAAFPTSGLILLSKVSLVILDQNSTALPLWMQFLLNDDFALVNNFDETLIGFLPSGLTYADGVITVQYSPDPGASTIRSNMAVNIDFSQDSIYLDVAT